ncbi:MAG: hypothetical protein R3F59_00545 [Myxococcota bacterium]
MPAEAPCERIRPDAGEIVVDVARCNELVPGSGEGRAGTDLYLADHDWRVVIRHPLDAISVPGLGGGTVVDAAPWTGLDTVHEAIPLVGGGWLAAPTLQVFDDGFAFTGAVASIPGLPPAGAEGEVRTVRYRADGAALVAEGATGWWIHPRGDVELLDGVAASDGQAVGASGQVLDYGGAYVVLGTDRLVIATDAAIWGLRTPGPHRIAGTAPGAHTIALYRGGTRVGRVPVAGDAFSFQADASVEEVQAEAPGRAPSPRVPAGTDLDLALGAAGTLTLEPRWPDALPHWMRVAWTAADGRAGEEILDPEGGTLRLGAGAYTVTMSAGPAQATITIPVELHPDEDLTLPLRLPVKIGAGTWVLAGFGRPADRSRDWRGSDVTAAREAAADGLVYATFTPPNDVAGVVAGAVGMPRLRVRNGLLQQGEGFAVASWPWPATSKDAAHGGPHLVPADPLAALQVLSGGPDDARTLLVDLDWLAAVGAPFTVDPPPALVALRHPGKGASAWAPWLAWLDAQRPVVPTGPATWAKVADPAVVGLQDVEQALARGAVSAGTGPRVTLVVDGAGPGDQVPPWKPALDSSDTAAADTADTGGPPDTVVRRVTVTVAPFDGLQHLVLLGSEGQQTALPLRDAVLDLPLAGSWVAAAAWSDDPAGPWAVTGPVWLRAP